MEISTTYLVIIIVAAVLMLTTLILVIVMMTATRRNIAGIDADIARIDVRIQTDSEASNARMDSYFTSYAEILNANQRMIGEAQDARLKALEDSMARLRNDNNLQFNSMRMSIDEKLQAVQIGLGEMQTVAGSVGDLKKVLTNVKTRGILGEVQLAAILEQIMNHEQYEENVATVSGSANRVEFAIRLPGDGEDIVYLPIDSKFPGDSYAALMDAYDTGDKAVVDKMKSILRTRLRSEAKDIRDKYIAPPETTDFGVMFLPFEGLYAEAVNMGMVEELQRDYKVTIAGPTTMAALLNSLQMGFNTLAIEKKSSEVWNILAEVKKEFEKFDNGLGDARNRLAQADKTLEELQGVRTRAINRKLRDVMILDEPE